MYPFAIAVSHVIAVFLVVYAVGGMVITARHVIAFERIKRLFAEGKLQEVIAFRKMTKYDTQMDGLTYWCCWGLGITIAMLIIAAGLAP
ncbi:hypothetical protein AVT69_gp281 [Pseudomonas phage PhiPA3]|uniref:Uncharacterized protein 283 n=1 Tax=Pseudomonas phage PhiPA3 TaxID=998086 RepID=F8SJB9_BPPA3|nr:hypothetical protein AVT69_gp281 [Pseudomonas phage PhiPA3]AEH03706.1 hypothetical protein [Pseudomonas phage PhiPA3]